MWAQLEAAVRPRGEAKVADSTALTLPLPTHQVLLSADPATEILARSVSPTPTPHPNPNPNPSPKPKPKPEPEPEPDPNPDPNPGPNPTP